ncbi:GNAT family N-acetyltransferase [Aureibacillus halotolerans]|uniref:RimJ/RimL family protein N-acetyltransferase n=1 Tax=Aureibacillus halotolerans TaxID=1508390 RepID=A0A4V3D5P6_9BACI|nr:GNAT family protein [Aureibacillus halotolerans]TDQ40877.1 RimJ/RimL family protein N-acetyltransferase [Aureibacillus halotolerans]
MFESDRLYLRLFEEKDAETLLALELKNRDYFSLYSGTRKDDFYTIDAIQKKIQEYIKQATEDKSYQFGIYEKGNNELIGKISLNSVQRHVLQNCVLGYMLDKEQNGKGYMSEAIKLIVSYAFEKLELHRIGAGVMPHNGASMRVLEKAGFHKEGLARKNVNINGRWEDHEMFAIINPAHDVG